MDSTLEHWVEETRILKNNRWPDSCHMRVHMRVGVRMRVGGSVSFIVMTGYCGDTSALRLTL